MCLIFSFERPKENCTVLKLILPLLSVVHASFSTLESCFIVVNQRHFIFVLSFVGKKKIFCHIDLLAEKQRKENIISSLQSQSCFTTKMLFLMYVLHFCGRNSHCSKRVCCHLFPTKIGVEIICIF